MRRSVHVIRAIGGVGDDWSGELPQGCPLFFDHTFDPMSEPTRFCCEILLGYSNSLGTATRYAYALRTFLEALRGLGIDWRKVDRELLFLYRGRLQKAGLRSTTINIELKIVRKFYQWATDEGAIDEFPFRELRPGERDPLLLTGELQSKRGIPARALDKIYRHLSPKIRLCAVIAACTGLRAHEVCKLLVYDFKTDMDDFLEIVIRRKGGRQKPVFFPLRLVDEIRRYIDLDRSASVSSLKRKGLSVRSPFVFLNKRGARLSEKGMSTEFRKAVTKAGFQDHGKYVFHALRNNFGNTTHELILRENEARRSEGETPVDVLLGVKSFMGHARVETSERYLAEMSVQRRVQMTSILHRLYEDVAPTQRIG